MERTEAVKVLVTGGAGYIGSTVVSALLDEGWQPVVLDDLSTGRAEFVRGLPFFSGDVGDRAVVEQVFRAHPDIAAVVHCAAKIVVPDSVSDPLRYYDANVVKTVRFLAALVTLGCTRVVFSSTAALYGHSRTFAVDEQSRIDPMSPYAWSKAMVERILEDSCAAGLVRAVAFRYFNPIGADPSLRTGLQLVEPTHALGMMILSEERDEPFTVTGTQWPTPDGTGIRDYVHVWDIALAHVAALRRFDEVVTPRHPFEVLNLGMGRGVTVRELLRAYQEVSGRSLRVISGPPRAGDTAGAYATVAKAQRLLDWSSTMTLERGIADSIAWRSAWMAHLAGGTRTAGGAG